MNKARVLIALSNRVLSEGIARLLDEDRIEGFVPMPDTGSPSSAIEVLRPDVVLVDFFTLYNSFSESDLDTSRFVLIDTSCGRENITGAIVDKGIKGVLPGEATPALLNRALLAVASGDVWLDKTNVRGLIRGLQGQRQRQRQQEWAFSTREKEVIALVVRGLRNREIAERLDISEPTVKTHLTKIFRKLGISSRPQLITFAAGRSPKPRGLMRAHLH